MSLRQAIRDLEGTLTYLDDPAMARNALQAVISGFKDIDQRLVTLENKALGPDEVKTHGGEAGTASQKG